MRVLASQSMCSLEWCTACSFHRKGTLWAARWRQRLANRFRERRLNYCFVRPPTAQSNTSISVPSGQM